MKSQRGRSGSPWTSNRGRPTQVGSKTLASRVEAWKHIQDLIFNMCTSLTPPPTHLTWTPYLPIPHARLQTPPTLLSPSLRLLLSLRAARCPTSPSDLPSPPPPALPGRTLSLWMAPSMMCPAVIEHYEVFHASLH